jgi:hypothetical protein
MSTELKQLELKLEQLEKIVKENNKFLRKILINLIGEEEKSCEEENNKEEKSCKEEKNREEKSCESHEKNIDISIGSYITDRKMLIKSDYISKEEETDIINEYKIFEGGTLENFEEQLKKDGKKYVLSTEFSAYAHADKFHEDVIGISTKGPNVNKILNVGGF